MMGNQKLSAIRERLRTALADEGSNPLASLDRKIRRLAKKSQSEATGPKSLRLLRGALAQIIEEKPKKAPRTSRTKRPKKAV